MAQRIILNRRRFLTACAGTCVAATALSAESRRRQRIAFLGTEVRTHSHAQHFLDRLSQGYNWKGQWVAPRVDIASIYIDQFPVGDLARSRAAKHNLRIVPTIADALTLGGSKLAVDGVVIIAEHGDYPNNEMGQKLYPRYAWFKEVVKTFEETGQSAPVFNDKHLSTRWSECEEMVTASQRLGFPFLAGSSLPVTWRLPATEIPYDADLRESVCVAYGGVDSYDFHALETAQCMSERRRGGEPGVRSVHALRGQDSWDRLDREDCEMTRRLVVAALTRSHNLPVQTGYPSEPVTYEWAKNSLPDTTGYFVEHRDGFRTTILLTDIRDFNYAGYRADTDEIISCQMYLPMPTHGSTTADFFNPLTRHIENLVLVGKAAYPVQRTLLTSGMVIAGVKSLFKGQTPIQTPEFDVRYQAPRESQFWNA
ncbi:hypothetical protein OAS39_11435 [Pirellulales bacterium]|nr:hypothetical protein [Pirellulales bacterium]